MSGKKCCLCHAPADGECAAILTMGAYGNPRYLCESCEALIDKATLGTDYAEISEAMDSIGKIMVNTNVDDPLVLDTVTGMLGSAAERAKAIRSGEYDFSLDAKDGDNTDELTEDIPEELRETEEDKALDERDSAANARFDRIFSYVVWALFAIATTARGIYDAVSGNPMYLFLWLPIGALCLGVVIWKLIKDLK